MKRILFFKIFAVCIAITINFDPAVAQSSSTGFSTGTPNIPNTPGSDYLGWALNVNLPLMIKNEDAEPIRFYTNAGAGNNP